MYSHFGALALGCSILLGGLLAAPAGASAQAASGANQDQIKKQDTVPPATDPKLTEQSGKTEPSAKVQDTSPDPNAVFVYVDDPDEVPADATAFDIRGVELSHRDGGCSFETFLRVYELDDPVLWKIAEIIHEADIGDERYDAPEAAGLDVLIRGLSMVKDDDELLALTGPLYDGLYEYLKRATLLGRTPS